MKPKYKMSRETLYLVLRMIGTNLRNKRTNFEAYKGFYLVSYCDAFDAAITAAEGMPTEAQRDALAKEERIAMGPLRDTSMFNFMDLERYAASTWTDPLVLEAKLIVAGKNYYHDAGNDHWASVKEMNRLGNQFLLDNDTALEAGLNMPHAFLATFLAGKNAFANKYSSFVTDESAQPAGQTSKMQAENDLWHQATKVICPDGIAIARGNEVFMDLFTIEEIKQIVAAGGGSGVKGNVFTGVAELPLDGVTIHIDALDLSFANDAHGKFRSPAFASGTYTIRFTKTGYLPVTLVDVVINVHVFHTVHVAMVAV